MAGPEMLGFDVHGEGVLVECPDAEVRQRIANDFAWFTASPAPRGEPLRIQVRLEEPAWESLPALRASVYSPRNICYAEGDRTWIDYFGRGLALWDAAGQRLEVWSADAHLLHEIVYLAVLSRVGERLERRGIHRVHALGVERNGEAALFLMPSGGGKTTLGLEFLRSERGERLLSEDSPLIDRRGRVLPFPLRIGVAGEVPPEISPEHVSQVERMEFEPKRLIALEAFRDRIASGPAVPRLVFLGNRLLGDGCRIRPASLAEGAAGFLRHMVVGVGLYQGVEFLLQTSALDLLRKTPLFVSRLVRAGQVLRQADVFVLELGRDVRKNATEIAAFLEARGFGGAPRA